jgi:hypothetical protein
LQQYRHLADIPPRPRFGRYRRHSGHYSALALNGLVANDPEWPIREADIMRRKV